LDLECIKEQKMEIVKNNPFNTVAKEYDQWFDSNESIFFSELEAVKYFMPKYGEGIEIGVGTGRFASELGIKQGVEPSEQMAEIARERGIEVKIGIAENLEFADESFDFVIMVAVDPFVNDIQKTYHEIFRIIRKGGKLIVGTLHKDGEVAKKYMAMKDSEVYKSAKFHAVDETINQLKTSGFGGFRTCQTLIEMNQNKIEKPVPLHDKGSFVAIEALK